MPAIQELEGTTVEIPATQMAAWIIALEAIAGVMIDEDKVERAGTLYGVASGLRAYVPGAELLRPEGEE